jgi:hypothetical protein
VLIKAAGAHGRQPDHITIIVVHRDHMVDHPSGIVIIIRVCPLPPDESHPTHGVMHALREGLVPED